MPHQEFSFYNENHCFRRDIATADDENHAHFFVCQILGTLREGNHPNCH